MKKTMYTATKNLAEFVFKTEKTRPEEIWTGWCEKYNPPEEMKEQLKNVCKSLCEIDKSHIQAVPEYAYRETIKLTLKPEINKEELSNES